VDLQPISFGRYVLMDINPILSRPVKRPHFVVPSTCVDVVHGTVEQRISVAIELVHGRQLQRSGSV